MNDAIPEHDKVRGPSCQIPAGNIFRHSSAGAGILHIGPHAIPTNETPVFLRVESAFSLSPGLGSMTPRLILCVCHLSGTDVRRPSPSKSNFRHPLQTPHPHSADIKNTCFLTAWARHRSNSGLRVGTTSQHLSQPTMEIENRVELPDGHLVNLSPRPQHQPQYKAYRADYASTELSPAKQSQNTHRVYPSELAECRSPVDTMYQKGKATKLPVPKTLLERGRDQRNQTPSPTAIPKPSPTAFSSGGSGAQSGERDRDRDRYWSKLRDKFEKESSPLSQRVSYHRTRETDKKDSPNQANNWQESRYTAVREEATSRVPQPRRTVPTPTANVKSSSYNALNELCHSDSHKPWQIQEGHWSPVDGHETTAQKSEMTDTTTESSPRSRPSISPVSDDSSVTDCDWEDRFVVHMPSAKEPNPPMMTSQQITEYQKSIEKVRRDGGQMVDPNTRPSPRKDSPEGKPHLVLPRDRKSGGSGQFKAYDGRPMQLQPEVDRQPAPAPPPAPVQEPSPQSLGPQGQKNYYSPDEVGKNRISTIWEEQSPTRSKEKRSSAITDGSFLGCKEINGPGTKNPDEILLFASGENSKNLQPRPLAANGRKKQKEEKKKAPRKSEESRRAPRKSEESHLAPHKSGESLVQEEWAQLSRNSKQAPCSRSSSATLCQEPICSQNELPRTDSNGSSKENFYLAPSTSSSSEKLEGARGDDDVFIITPTITRTMLPTPTPEKQERKKDEKREEKKASIPKAQGLRRPGGTGQSGTGEAVKAIRAKAQVISTPSGLRPAAAASQVKSTASSLASSKTTPLSSIPTAKDKEKEKDSIATTATTTTTATKEVSATKQEVTVKNSPKSKDKEKDDHAKQAGNSIRGFIRTSGLARSTGLVRSPTESLATILRNGTESLRNRAESLRKGNGSSISRNSSPISQPSGPSRDNSESSRSERSFRSARENATPPPSSKPSPAKKENQSPASKPSAEKPSPMEKASKAEMSPPVEKPVEKSPLSAEKIARAERLERFKEQARLRRATRTIEIAELDGHQVPSNKKSLQSNITDVCDDLGDLGSQDKDETSKDAGNAMALSMIFEIVFVAVAHMHKGLLQVTDSPYAKFVVSNVLNMVRHCYRVFSRVYRAVSKYQTTGTWPKATSDQAVSRFLTELLQAIMYLFILGFAFTMVGRAASYIVLVGSWIVWFARPFAWAFQCVGRALLN